MNNKMKLTTANKKMLPEIKKYLRAKVPILNPSEIRRSNLPLHEAIESELRDEGLVNAAELVKMLLHIDKELQRDNELLKDSKKDLLFIKQGLKKAEESKKLGHFDDEISTYLMLARHFEHNNNISFYWVAKEFYLISVKLSDSELVLTTKGSKAYSNFYFGRFLNQKLKKFEQAGEHLSLAKESSFEREELYLEDQVLYGCVCYELAQSLIKIAQALIKKDPLKALEQAQKAIKVVPDIGKLELQLDCYLEIGDCFQLLENPLEACHSYKLSLHKAKMTSNVHQQCQSLIKIGTCFKVLERLDKATTFYEDAKQLATENNLKEEYATALTKLAYILIQNNDVKTAKKYINEALDIFLGLGKQNLATEARMLSGLAMAQEIFNPLVETIYKANEEGLDKNEYRKKLELWNDRKVPFWDQHSSQPGQGDFKK